MDDVALGTGVGLHQLLDRGTRRFAMKCSAARIDGGWHDVFKQPIADWGRGGRRGRLALPVTPAGAHRAIPVAAGQDDLLQAVCRDGELPQQTGFVQMRGRAPDGAVRLAGCA